MINRRELLVRVGAATLSAATASTSALAELLNDAAAQSVDERLRQDLARLTPRANSEEGVPVFLACLNLVADKSTHKVPPVQLTPLNRTVAAEFRQVAAAWERIRPNSPASDVAEVIVVLADRDFSNGGTGKTS
jgi:hypothetical protein